MVLARCQKLIPPRGEPLSGIPLSRKERRYVLTPVRKRYAVETNGVDYDQPLVVLREATFEVWVVEQLQQGGVASAASRSLGGAVL